MKGRKTDGGKGQTDNGDDQKQWTTEHVLNFVVGIGASVLGLVFLYSGIGDLLSSGSVGAAVVGLVLGGPLVITGLSAVLTGGAEEPLPPNPKNR